MLTKVEEYQKFAMDHDGDRARGRELFNNEQRAACAKCHSVDGTGAKTGPDLYSAGDQYPRRDLVEAVLRPSATIAVGYSTTLVETKAGDGGFGGLQPESNLHIRSGPDQALFLEGPCSGLVKEGGKGRTRSWNPQPSACQV